MTSETREGQTPNGGDSSKIYYLDDKGNPAEKDKAVQVKIEELKGTNIIFRTYGKLGK